MPGPELHTVAHARLRRDGQRYTEQRREIVDVLAGSEHPVTIRELLARRPGLAQSSVYRNLAVLEHAGVVGRLVTNGDSACYELAEELTGHHHHLICVGCGTVRDIVIPPTLEESLGNSLAHLTSEHGFTLDHHRLDLLGRCPACR